MRFAVYNSKLLEENSWVYKQTDEVYDNIDLIQISEFKNPSNLYVLIAKLLYRLRKKIDEKKFSILGVMSRAS